MRNAVGVIDKLSGYLNNFRNRPWWMIRLIISRFLLTTGLCRLLTIKLGNTKLRFFPTKFSADLWFPSVNILAEYNLPFLHPGDTVIDVGANIGFTTLLFKKLVGDVGKVFAFEPNPVVFKYLQKNIELNKIDNVFLFNYAVGERKGKVLLRDNKKDDTFNKITQNRDNGFAVDMDCLDSLLKDFLIETVNLLKIDTEGYEKFVLLGAKGILAKTRAINFEGTERLYQQFHYNLAEVVNLLESSGFFVYGFNKGTNRFEIFNIKNNNDIYSQDFFAVRDPSLMKDVKWI